MKKIVFVIIATVLVLYLGNGILRDNVIRDGPIPGRCYLAGDFLCTNTILEENGNLKIVLQASSPVTVHNVTVLSNSQSDVICNQTKKIEQSTNGGDNLRLNFSCSKLTEPREQLGAELIIAYTTETSKITKEETGVIIYLKEEKIEREIKQYYERENFIDKLYFWT